MEHSKIAMGYMLDGVFVGVPRAQATAGGKSPPCLQQIDGVQRAIIFMPAFRYPDGDVVDDVPDDDPAWNIACPLCEAKPADECIGVTSGCGFGGMHADRVALARK